MELELSFAHLHAVLVGISGMVVLMLGWYVLAKRGRSKVNQAFFLLSLAISIWLLGFSFGAASPTSEQAVFWEIYVGHVGVMAISPTLFLFVVTYLNVYKRFRTTLLVSYAFAPIFYLLIYVDPHFLPHQTYHHYFGWYKRVEEHYLIFIAYFAFNLIFSVALLISTYYNTQDGAQKKRLRSIVDGIAFASLGMLDWLPSFGYPLFYPLGYIAILIFSFTIFSAVSKHHLMDAETALKQSEERYRRVVEQAAEGIFLVDITTRQFMDWNKAFDHLLGYPSGEIAKLTLYDVVTEEKEKINQYIQQVCENRQHIIAEWQCRRKNGTLIDVEVSANIIAYGGGEALCMVVRDTTERKWTEKMMMHHAYYDSLTGLPNRLLFEDRLKMLLASRERDHLLAVVIFIDLDYFKKVNDTLGHAMGDHVLKGVAQRLTGALREGDTVARLGGDEFILLCPQTGHPEYAVTVGQKVIELFNAPFIIESREIYVTPSIGISLYPGDGTETETLIKNADMAMYRAKEVGRNNFQLYAPSMNSSALDRLSLENALRHALEQGDFLLHYHPQIDLATGEMIGMEALLRWKNKDGGLIAPKDFIPVAEETGLIVPLGEWALMTACMQNKIWHDQGISTFPISVNISARQFRQKNIEETVASILKKTGLSPHLLTLELTESAMMDDVETMMQLLCRLVSTGVYLSVDDFGTGYSSLNYLKRFPINTLKIDQSFVREIIDNPDDQAISIAIIRMAHSLNMKVIAEGVETQEQLTFLKSHHCDGMQGYLISRPLPTDAIETFMREKSGVSLI